MTHRLEDGAAVPCAAGGAAQAFFLPVKRGLRFCLYHAPRRAAPSPCAFVYVHPFAEEMNKARRMAALQARRLAAAGHAVLQIDLEGCGDSSGDFADARWEGWKLDVRAACEWLRERNAQPVGLWGLRLGASLAVDVARDPEAKLDRLLLWQPVVSGEAFLTQFLRLQLAAEMLSAGAASSGMQALRAALAQGRSLEIGGYELAPELAHAIERVRLAQMPPSVRRVSWLEVSAPPEARITPGSQRVLEGWRAAGVAVDAAAVAGEPFWSTLEIAECEALLGMTDARFAGQAAAAES